MTHRLVASASSTHPVPSHAVGEVIGAIADSGVRPDLALLVLAGGHAGALEDAASTAHALLGPAALVGLTAPGPAVAPGRSPVGGATLWVGALGAVSVCHHSDPTELVAAASQFTVLLACACTVDTGRLLLRVKGAPIAGGTVSGGTPTEPARFVVDGVCRSGGVVAIGIDPARIGTVRQADGWVVLGPSQPVTEVDGSRISTIGGRPAAEPIETIAGLDGAPGHIALGLVVGETGGAELDVVAVRITAIDADAGAVEVDRPVAPGAAVQLLLWRPQAAARRLGAALGSSRVPPGGALSFRPASARFDPFGAPLPEPEHFDPSTLADLTVIESFVGLPSAPRTSTDAVNVVWFTSS